MTHLLDDDPRRSDRRIVGANNLVYHDEFVAAQIGQVGTQFDGLGHIGIQHGADDDRNEMQYHNGFTELAERARGV